MDSSAKQVYVHKASANIKMDTDQEWMPQASHSTQNNHQILHYKRLVVPANMRSIYWKCYGFPANDDNEILTKSKIICLLCKSTMTYNRNTTNLRMHLQNKHKNELAALELMQPSPSNKKGDPDKRSIKKPKRPSTGPSAKAGTTQQHPQVVQVFPINNSSTSGLDQAVEKAMNDQSSSQFLADVDDMNPLTVIVKEATSNSGQVEPLQNYTMVDGKAIAEAIAEFVILDLQNPDIVEGKGFQRLIGTLKSPCEIPSKALLTDELIPKIYDVVKQQVLQEISTLTVNTSLSIEDWVSSCGDNYSTVSIHFITSRDNELQTRVLSTIYCSEVDVQHWGAQFDSTMEEFQVKLDKIKGIVVASERDDVRDSLIARGFTVLPCFSHTLQVCSKSVFERSDVQDVVKKCRALVAHISRNSTAMAELRLQDNLIQLEDSPMVLDHSSGWMTTLSMIEQLHARRNILHNVLDCLSSTICPTTSFELTENEWSMLEDIAAALSPFKVTVATLVEEKNPLISIMKPILCQLLNVHLEKSPTDSHFLASLKTNLIELLMERYRGAEVNETLEIASALDPRFKNLPFLTDQERQEVKQKLTTYLKNEAQASGTVDDNKAVLARRRQSGRGMEYLLGEMVQVKTEMPSNQRFELELVQYEWENPAELDKSAIEWWREMSGKCSHMVNLAWSYLCIPVCARGHLQNTLSPNYLLQNLPAQFALKLKFLNSNYVASSD
ncbi:ZnF_BED [Nesidiocoris tenuis]|uniref:ZnF_BED n=1 Tax=Nesidiocoris tenuis TaxID=355587 RepID=A0ABN7BBV1_9HEMI|nr:ZnF_BED [Nesidiocoris tenuis]